MTRKLRLLPFLIVPILLAGCNLAPPYHRPDVDIPGGFRNLPADQAQSAASLGDEKWWTVFKDEELQKLIRTALIQNYDLRIAADHILQAQAQVGITRADQFPSVSGVAGYASQRLPGVVAGVIQLEALFSWTPDFWGRYRNATKAARAELLANEWSRRQVTGTLVSSLATTYFQLRELDLELDISKNTLASRQESLKLTQTLANGGAVGLIDVRQAEQLVQTAAEAVPDVERRIAEQEDLISTLAGENPGDIPRGLALTEQPLPESVPAGLPSRLLERRPDILEAEQRLVAANAQIGVARAALFPSLPLTEAGGLEAANFAKLVSGNPSAWNVSAPITQPIFTAGRLRSSVKLTEAQRQEAVLGYQQTIQQAFRQVSDGLIDYQKDREFREHQDLLTSAAQGAANLSETRYRGGAASYLEVLTSESNYFAAEINLARAQLNERLSLVQLYVALGGGWEQ